MYKNLLKIIRNFAVDFYRYIRYSGAVSHSDFTSDRAEIMMDCHRVEKGLALPEPRFQYGSDVFNRLRGNVLAGKVKDEYISNWLSSVVDSYKAYHEDNEKMPSDGAVILSELLDSNRSFSDYERGLGGILDINTALVVSDFDTLAKSRHSVRNFSDSPVDVSIIRSAVDTARYTPSVCNRQAWRVHHIKSDRDRRRCLEIQGGCSGFIDNIPELLIVTYDLRYFLTPAERYQGWFDSGLFAMSLVYALTDHGLGTCFLNWSVDPSRDKALRSVYPIPGEENIAVLIAVGNLKRKYSVAKSPRISVDEILH